MAKVDQVSTAVHQRVLPRRRFGHPLANVSLGILICSLIAGLTVMPTVNAGAANTIKSDKPYAQAQLLKRSNLPSGWTQSSRVWVGTSADRNSESMLTMTQYPDLATCLGKLPALSVVAAEATSPGFFNNNQGTNLIDVADVYASASDAEADFPPLSNPKFGHCLMKVLGSSIVANDKYNWPSGTTFGTPIDSISHRLKYGNQSGLIEVQVPVKLPEGEGTTSDFLVVLVIRQGRSTAELQIDQGDTTPSAALTESLARAVTAKMKARPPTNTIIAA
jgi:hypothetical protein